MATPPGPLAGGDWLSAAEAPPPARRAGRGGRGSGLRRLSARPGPAVAARRVPRAAVPAASPAATAPAATAAAGGPGHAAGAERRCGAAAAPSPD